MVTITDTIDLGRDTTRIKDPRDAARQKRTVEEILLRFYHPDPERRNELQVLADEVGMGKTFVALAAAYSILNAMKEGSDEESFKGCYQRVLIITPQNTALFNKWMQETGEFVKRCVTSGQDVTRNWFAPYPIRRIDDLSASLRKKGNQPRIIVTTMNLFAGGKLLDLSLKRQFILGILFRNWGTRFKKDRRERLLRGAPDGWPKNPAHLTWLDEHGKEKIPFEEDEVLDVIKKLDRADETIDRVSIEGLLEQCLSISELYSRKREEAFESISTQLAKLYRIVATELIRKDFPLVIVDEAHNWKNGPTNGTNGYRDFERIIASRTRRLLLMTATPFQLRPDEMLELLKSSDRMNPATTRDRTAARTERLLNFREQVIRPTLQGSADASRNFVKAWRELPSDATSAELTELWSGEILTAARHRLHAVANESGVVDHSRLDAIIVEAMKHVRPELRRFLKEAMHVYTHNADLSQELGTLVIRHRRMTEHRLFKVGGEYARESVVVAKRPDRHVLHGAIGLDVRGEGELPHYLLMRCVTEMKRANKKHGKSSLGSSLTGCYSTLLDSAEGKGIQKVLGASPAGKRYLDLLMTLVDETQDPSHPKMRAVISQTIENWKRGEKTLIFCFRVNTAKRLQQIIDNEIRKEMNQRSLSRLGGEKQLATLRRRLTARTEDLINIGLDRVLWSVLWRCNGDEPAVFGPKDLLLRDEELEDLAELSISFDTPVTGDKADRVFLHRCIEQLVAKRLIRSTSPNRWLEVLLKHIGSKDWIRFPYGFDAASEQEAEGEDQHEFDERGIHTKYVESSSMTNLDSVKELTLRLREARDHARATKATPIIDSYAEGANLWLHSDPVAAVNEVSGRLTGMLRHTHERLWTISQEGDGRFDWASRKAVMAALRRTLLRRSILLRILPDRTELKEASWAEMLVERFYAALPGQHESMADRIAVFLEDLAAASGSISSDNVSEQGLRYELIAATRLSDQRFVALVTGDQKNRERVFTGFNTPLLPEVLVCTQVGQEGIDLHRHCRHVIHYDLAWNPAVLEQRTGRADRIGSKTFRERNGLLDNDKPFLEIGVPFLAGTYDERMYEELRLRAQMFEVLTGGEFAAENAEGTDDDAVDEGQEQSLRFVPLPENMVQDLRVSLHVWEDDSIMTII